MNRSSSLTWVTFRERQRPDSASGGIEERASLTPSSRKVFTGPAPVWLRADPAPALALLSPRFISISAHAWLTSELQPSHTLTPESNSTPRQRSPNQLSPVRLSSARGCLRRQVLEPSMPSWKRAATVATWVTLREHQRPNSAACKRRQSADIGGDGGEGTPNSHSNRFQRLSPYRPPTFAGPSWNISVPPHTLERCLFSSDGLSATHSISLKEPTVLRTSKSGRLTTPRARMAAFSVPIDFLPPTARVARSLGTSSRLGRTCAA